MDAIAQLALMAKAKRVFESDTTFLSFPALSPLSYLPEELRFGGAGEMTAADLAEASEFARTTNQIPRSVIAPMDEGEYLWDVYREVLETGRVAARTMSAAEADIYAAALALLYTTDADGLRTDSVTLRTYKQHRDAVIEAQEEYRNQQLTAEASSEPAVLVRWKDEDEPRLRAIVAEREDAWATSGSKASVEAAQQFELAGAAGSPTTVWNEWRSAFLDDLDLLTDTSQIRFAITGYSPYDVFESDDWPRFKLSADEIRRLTEEAPAELREIFAGGSGESEIESMSFEYRSVAVTRPWLRPGLFKSRFWRLPDGAEPLSDGSDQGRCPAYICGLVFARKVSVTSKEREGDAVAPTSPRQFFRLQASALSPKFALLATAGEPAVQPAPSAPVTLVRDHRTVASAMGPLSASRASLRLKAIGFGGAEVASVARPIAAMRASGLGLHVRALDAVSGLELVDPPAQPTPEPVPEPAPPPEPPARQGEVMVLAFICKRIGRSPDPDPTLAWG